MSILFILRSETVPASWQQEMGGFNDFPPNWMEISSDEFWQKMHNNSPNKIEHRQIHPEDGSRMIIAQLLYFGNKEGIAYTVDWKHEPFTSSDKDQWIPRFFKFAACLHKWKEVLPQQYNCHHKYKCDRCGETYAIDSSD